MTEPVIDLDANATTRTWPEVAECVARHLRETTGNPGSRHVLGRRARRVLETSRESIASILGAEPDELLFTSGGTEANNLAVFGLPRGSHGTIALSPGEHPSVNEACTVLQQRGYKLHRFPVDADGRIQLEAPWPEVKLCCVLWGHNETGIIQNVPAISDTCRSHGVPLHLDGVQVVGKLPVDFHATGAAALSFGAHKFHGPRGIGGLLIRQGTRLTPSLVGGFQEQGKRAGTEPVALVAGMALALELWQRDQEARTQTLTRLRDRLQSRLVEQCPFAVVHAAEAPRLPNTLNIAFPGIDGEALLVALDLAGVCASLGSACASGSTEPSPILVAMGCDPAVYRSSLRLSVSVFNTMEGIDHAVDVIATTVAKLRVES
ncbi:MAG TPA: cysteine desulfurase family protein [Planctomycetaceae bacterium]|nr:cysteine desulfurase family protein [Planctomycetaceae bacterium]